MPNEVNLSDEALREHRAIAEKADIPGPWFENGEVTIRPPHGYEQEFYEVADEGDGIYEYNIAYCHSKDDAAHIAANSPKVVIAHIDEIIRLRSEVELLSKEAHWLGLHLSNAMMVPVVLDSLQMASAPEGRIPTPKMIREQVRRDLAERDAARKAVEGA